MINLLLAFTLLMQVETLPVPDPAPNGDIFTGPFENLRDSIIERFDKRADENNQQMQGLLDRLRQRDDATVQEFGALRDWLKQRDAEDTARYGALLDRLREREDTESQRYHGLRGILEQIRDRPQLDTSGLFPRIAELREEIQGVRDMQSAMEMSTGPIREALGMLTTLVYGLILLAGTLLVVDVYRTFFRRA
jgi:Rad3-related DNA helicase